MGTSRLSLVSSTKSTMMLLLCADVEWKTARTFSVGLGAWGWRRSVWAAGRCRGCSGRGKMGSSQSFSVACPDSPRQSVSAGRLFSLGFRELCIVSLSQVQRVVSCIHLAGTLWCTYWAVSILASLSPMGVWSPRREL